jgi:hypothetical protein
VFRFQKQYRSAMSVSDSETRIAPVKPPYLPEIASLTHGAPTDPCWTSVPERLLIEATDALHDRGDIGDELWGGLTEHFSPEQLLDAAMLAGWYHAISYAANAARVPLEDGAPRFADAGVRRMPD